MTTMQQPPDLVDLVETYAGELAAFASLARSLDADHWGLATECPGWTVHDQVAHVVALEGELAGGPLAPALPAYGPHVRNPVGERMENGVDALRGMAPHDLLTALDAACRVHLAQLRGPDLDGEALVTGPRGTALPLRQLLVLRVFDVWAHEQDVRRAVGRPGGLGSPAAVLAVDRVVTSLPFVVGKELAPPPGTSVAVTVTGAVPVAVTVRVGPDGRAVATEGASPGASVALQTDTETFTRLACGRIDPAEGHVAVVGDAVLGSRLLAALTLTP